MNPEESKLLVIPATDAYKVFFNFSFTEEYKPIMRSIVYTLYRCGFTPITAFSENNAATLRLNKLARLIKECPHSIHDISYTELDPKSNLPRFNMPFELGIFYGLVYYDNASGQKVNAVVLDKADYNYQKFLSDLNGIDIKVHKNDEFVAIEKIIEWLFAEIKTIPSPEKVKAEYRLYLKIFPHLAELHGYDKEKIHFNHYCYLTEDFIKGLARN